MDKTQKIWRFNLKWHHHFLCCFPNSFIRRNQWTNRQLSEGTSLLTHDGLLSAVTSLLTQWKCNLLEFWFTSSLTSLLAYLGCCNKVSQKRAAMKEQKKQRLLLVKQDSKLTWEKCFEFLFLSFFLLTLKVT